MSIELILKDIKDEYVLENFRRISQAFDDQTILNGNWKLFKVEIPAVSVGFKFKHNLDFIPNDIIVLAIKGNKRVDFRYDLFTTNHIVIDAEGKTCVTFLAGSYGVDCPADGFRNVPTFEPILTAGVFSELPAYLANGDVTSVEFFNSATQVTANRLARVDITYVGFDPTVETWKFYDTDGATLIRTITITNTFVANELTKSVQVSA